MPKSPTNVLPLTVANCDGCGVCCMHMGYPSYIEGSKTQPAEKYWINLPTHLRTELTEYRRRYQEPDAGELDGPCFWYDQETGRCKNHEFRPNVCRDFEVGCTDCLGWRKTYQIGMV